MSQKRKSGLQRGLSEIVERQTAPREDKSKLSRGLIDKFSDPRAPEATPPPPATLRTHSTQGSRGVERKPGKTTSLSEATAQPIAPARDFMKVANSISREAVPAGLFKGKSKQIYDYLYAKTRGAIVPARSAQLTRREIMRGANIGSDKTLRENLLHLRRNGLVTWDDKETVGAHDGNMYTVYLPEEAGATPATQGTLGALGYPRSFLPTVPMVETTVGTQGSSVDGAVGSGDSKTFIKTKDRSDDEPAALSEAFRQAERELTGKNSAKGEQWKELAEVIIAELKIAAARTTVSNVPAFLAEHLRRRLWKLDKKQAAAEGRELPDQGAAAASRASAPAECPDCKGSGWWYPQGQDKGVAKCRHERVAGS